MSLGDFRADLDLLGLRFTRSARFTIFTFFSDIKYLGEQVNYRNKRNLISESSDLIWPDLLGKQVLDAGGSGLVAERVYKNIRR